MQYFNYSNEDNDSDDTTVTVLKDLSTTDWDTLVKCSQYLDFSKGDIIINAGETDDGVYILVDGVVEVIAKGRFDRQKILAEINEGSIFGELAFFDKQPRSASIRAASDGQVLHLTHDGFTQIASLNPELAHQLIFDMGRVLAFRFRKLSSV